MTKLLFIHTGKCAGRTIRNLLQENGVNFKHIHVESTKSRIKEHIVWADEIIINIRDPIKRCISIYNHYKTVCGSEKDNIVINATKGCETLNEFIHAQKSYELFDNPTTHFGKNFYFFLSPLMKTKSFGKIKIVVRQEHFIEDIAKLASRYNLKNFEKIEEENRKREFSRRKKDPKFFNLSNFSKRKLHKILDKDYQIIDKLLERRLISMDYVQNFM